MNIQTFAKLIRQHPVTIRRKIKQGLIPAKMGEFSERDYRRCWQIDDELVNNMVYNKL